jgi:chromosomal replication initiator protein
MKHDALWSSIEKELAGVLPAHAMNTWFDPIYPVALSNGELLLEVPNQFFFEWIESHYKQNMRKAILAVTDEKIKHKFIVSAEREELKTDEPVFLKNYAVQKTTKPNINKNYLFETFIEGANNQFAKTASETVAGDLAKQSFNPLIIYGGVGLGKTHLIHAIGNRVFSENPTANVVLATSEKFTLDFVNSLRKNKTVEFAKQYRKADVLLIDDIQFFRGKEQTQEQFFHTFNELYQSGKQIVMTADRFPGEMQGLQDRLLSRFQSGLAVDIQPPDFEVRVAILMDKAEQNGVGLPYDIIEFIATHVKNNVRDLEGTIIRILAKSSLMNQDIDFDLVKEVVKERVGGQIMSSLSVEDVVRRVSDVFHIPEKTIVGKSRKMEIVEARQVAMYLCRSLIGDSLSNIGVCFGGRDHTTVIHAMRSIEKKKKKNKKLDKIITRIQQELNFGAV